MRDQGFLKRISSPGGLSRQAKTLLFDAGLAVSAVALYSPGLLALRPWDASILRAGSSIVGAIVLSWLFFQANFTKDRLPERIQADTVQSPDQILEALRSLDSVVFRPVISDAQVQMERLSRYMDSYPPLLSAKFPPGSLSYDKFDGIISSSVSAMLKNGVSMVNRIRMFDEEGYREIKKLVETGNYRHDSIPDELQEEKYRVFQKSFQSIRDIVSLNESIQLKLDALSIELTSLDTREIEVENNRIVDEIQTLIEETKFYTG